MTTIDPISQKIGTDKSNIRIIKNFIDENDRKVLLQYCKDNTKHTEGTIFYEIEPGELIKLQIKYAEKMYENIGTYYKDICPIRTENVTKAANILVHPKGSFMLPHVDIVGQISL